MRRWYFISLAFSMALVLVLVFYSHLRAVSSTTPNSWFEDSQADCAVVLTGGANRLREGLDLLYGNRVRKLIIAGVNPKVTLREIFPVLPYFGNLRETDVILERRSGTTYGNAQQTLPLVEALRCRDVLLITSTLHMYRAFRTFRGVYPNEITIIPRATVGGRLYAEWYDLFTEASKSMFYALWAY